MANQAKHTKNPYVFPHFTIQYKSKLLKTNNLDFGFGGKSWTDVSSFQNKFQHPKIFAFLKFEELGHLVNLTKTFKGQVGCIQNGSTVQRDSTSWIILIKECDDSQNIKGVIR